MSRLKEEGSEGAWQSVTGEGGVQQRVMSRL